MKRIALLIALAMSFAAWAQAPEQKKEAAKVEGAKPEAVKPAPAKEAAKAEPAKPTTKEAAKSAPPKTAAQKPATVAKKSRRHQDARHCLQRGDNNAIIRCAEEFL